MRSTQQCVTLQRMGWLSDLIAHLLTCYVAKKVKKTSKTGMSSCHMFCLHTAFPYRSLLVKALFFLMHGRDPALPITDMLIHPDERMNMDIHNYKSKIIACMLCAWQVARDHIQIAQAKQKRNHDKFKKVTSLSILEGDCVMLYVLAERSGKVHKFAGPF